MSRAENIEKWKGIVLETISYIEKEKEEKKTFPTHAIDLEISTLVQQRVKGILDLLVKDEVLSKGDTMNGKYYYLCK